MKLVGLLLMGLVSLCSASVENDLFRDFVAKYQRSYSLGTQEYSSRFEIFKTNLHRISQHNAENSEFTLAVNQFADLTSEEFAPKLATPPRRAGGARPVASQVSDPPPTFDWRDKGVVGPVQDEGKCGSSYVFAFVDSISSSFAIQNKTTFKQLSVDQLTTCTDQGCSGGDSEWSVIYVKRHGLYFQADWIPGNCPFNMANPGVCISGNSCMAANESDLAQTLIANGPLYVGIDASQPSFQLYSSGIYSDSHCSTTQLDHALLLVGYTADAWICQNSWGLGWGMKGYIQIARNKNMCGIATNACWATGVSSCYPGV